MKGSLIIVGFFILGIVVGNADLAPVLLRDSDVSLWHSAACFSAWVWA